VDTLGQAVEEVDATRQAAAEIICDNESPEEPEALITSQFVEVIAEPNSDQNIIGYGGSISDRLSHN